jgi:hypothetical protein
MNVTDREVRPSYQSARLNDVRLGRQDDLEEEVHEPGIEVLPAH